MFRQGVIWLLLATVAEVPPVVSTTGFFLFPSFNLDVSS